jgi:hypothetical protein
LWLALRSVSNLKIADGNVADKGRATPMPWPISKAEDNPPSAQIAAERKEKLEEFFNTPIDFFGKVVDENGDPVSGAKTFYIVASDSIDGSPTMNGPSTGQDGRFSIKGKHGSDLSVWVEHAAYYNTASADQKFEYASRQYAPGKEPPPLPTQNNPAIFVLRKKGYAEPLIHLKKTQVSLPMNGAPVTVDLRTGKIGGDRECVTFLLKSEADKLPLNEFHPFNWSVAVRVPNGGLVERPNALSFEAPAEKYPSEIMSENDPAKLKDDWSSVTKKDYFVSFGSGVYGRIRVEVSGEKGRAIVESYLNPNTGSRNLEFDPAKQVKSP